ncbi:MAG: CRISPR-associated protein Cas5 [Candidatus Electrothrix sp. ATG2]|nr:CRISPR-associated protein Cas5 [Candidatus Electrothrix sp. ATG2]
MRSWSRSWRVKGRIWSATPRICLRLWAILCLLMRMRKRMLILRLDAPFGVFRTFAAGNFRSTAAFITPSAAYGLVLNIAGIDMRAPDDGRSVATSIRSQKLPALKIALGVRGELPRQQSMLQQLHNYPVGAVGRERKAIAKGNPYNISPVRRTFLTDIHAYIAIRGDKDFEEQIVKGLDGKSKRSYGLPFIGDNSFMPDWLEAVDHPEPARWYERIDETSEAGVREDITRLTITIDRMNMERTRSALFGPQQHPSTKIPERAWVSVVY